MEESPGNKKIFVLVLALIIGASSFFHYKFITPINQAKNFTEAKLQPFGAAHFTIKEKKPEDQKIYRVGKVLVVVPEKIRETPTQRIVYPPELHRTWYRLSRDIRATTPAEVETLIRVQILGKSGRMYKKGIEHKYVSSSTIRLNIFNWKEKEHIGYRDISPGKFKGQVMTGEDLDKMRDATSFATIRKIIESLPSRRPRAKSR